MLRNSNLSFQPNDTYILDDTSGSLNDDSDLIIIKTSCDYLKVETIFLSYDDLYFSILDEMSLIKVSDTDIEITLSDVQELKIKYNPGEQWLKICT